MDRNLNIYLVRVSVGNQLIFKLGVEVSLLDIELFNLVESFVEIFPIKNGVGLDSKLFLKFASLNLSITTPRNGADHWLLPEFNRDIDFSLTRFHCGNGAVILFR